MTSDFVDVQLANQWLASCLSLIGRTFGEKSIHYNRLTVQFTNYPKWPNVEQALGVLISAREDYAKDALFDIKNLVEAELFEDFLEQAEHLMANGYCGPAAVVAGSVLEDALRRICQREGITLPEKPKLDWMNAELAKHGTYNKFTQKKLTSLADLRNSAAHGTWDDFDKGDVGDMIESARTFMMKYFS